MRNARISHPAAAAVFTLRTTRTGAIVLSVESGDRWSGDLTVRQAALRDASAIGDLVATATTKLWGQPPPIPESEGGAEAAWHRRIVSDEFDVFVADLDARSWV